MELTRCRHHRGADLVETIPDAIASIASLVTWFRMYSDPRFIAETIAESLQQRTHLQCCPAGSYALYLADAATRTYFAGE